MFPKPKAALSPNTYAYESEPMVKATGFREYDARWLFGSEINLMGIQSLGLGLGIGWAVLSSSMGWSAFTLDWIAPFGDIFINLHPEHLEMHNPGSLPLGVTPANILQKTVRRNNHLAQIFHDLKLMEREGTGYDRIYEAQLTQAKAVPLVREEDDRVVVRVERRILKPELIDLLARLDGQFGLSHRERIALGLIARHGSLTALEFGRQLQIEGDDRIRVWLGTLPAKGIVQSRGQTRATEYFIAPDVRRATGFQSPTTLKAIAPHRLEELIRADLALYPQSGLSDLHGRIGLEIPLYKLKRTLEQLRRRGVLSMAGQRRWARYSLAQPPPNNDSS